MLGCSLDGVWLILNGQCVDVVLILCWCMVGIVMILECYIADMWVAIC